MKACRIAEMLFCFWAVSIMVLPCEAQYVPSDPMRFTIWNPGLNAAGGIPNRAIIYTTIQASVYHNGTLDASADIQAALDDCPANEVVQLSAGTFTVNNYLLISKNITLRGSGPGVTILQKTNGAKPQDDQAADSQPIIIMGPGRWVGPDDNTSQDLTADGNKGDSTVIVANAATFKPGDFVLLDELSGASWQTDRLGRGQIWAAPDYRVAWQVHNPALSGDDPVLTGDTTYDPQGAGAWFCRLNRPTNEIKQIDRVSADTVYFNTPLHINYRAGSLHDAQLTGYTRSGNGGNGGVPITYAGVEDLTAIGGSNGAIRFECAAYSWVKDVEVTIWLGEGIAIDNAFRCVVRDSYIHDGAWNYPGGGGYAISLANGSAEILIENNISVRTNKVMVARSSGAGSVVGYNYMDDGYIAYNPSWIEIGLNGSHMVGSHHMLFEGNYGFNWDSDNTHGNSIYHTAFRNWLRGMRRSFTSTVDSVTINDTTNAGPLRCIGAMAYSSWMTFVGNVLGAQGQMGGWQLESNLLGGPPAIWMLGWDGLNDGIHAIASDSGVAATAIRDGNWDWLQSKQSWYNSSPATLQNSLYLTSKPAFFGSNPWPWVDPATGSVSTLPAKARFDSLMGITGVTSVSNSESPSRFALSQNYPNPFNPSTMISYQLPMNSYVTLKVYDVLGREVATLVNGKQSAGYYKTAFNAERLPSGVYFYRLQAGDYSKTMKLLLLK